MEKYEYEYQLLSITSRPVGTGTESNRYALILEERDDGKIRVLEIKIESL